MRSINGSVAAITGAGSGIGRATAVALARKGAALALSDVNARGLEETATLLPPGTHSLTTIVDVSKLDQMQTWASEVESHFGRASILVNNAGVSIYGFYEEYSRADLEWIMAVNFWGPVNGAQVFLPMLRREPAANIVTISSLYGIVAPAGNVGYAASKFAVRGFYEALRHELRDSPVRITVVHPGGVATNIAATSRTAAKTNDSFKSADVERFSKFLRMTPDDAAALIVGAIERDKKRLIVGGDAAFVEKVQRLFPASYASILARLLPGADAVALRAERTNATTGAALPATNGVATAAGPLAT